MEPAKPGAAQLILSIATAVEAQLDAEIDKLEKIDDGDLEKIRDLRLAEMKRQAGKRQQYLSKGHGKYQEISSEKEFFAKVKASDRVVCHFYRENYPCKVLDKHMEILAREHLETLFLKIFAEKSPYLTEKLKIVVLPTLALVLNAKVEDYVVGFDDLGGKEDFETEILEARLLRANVIMEGNGSRTRQNKNMTKSTHTVRQGKAYGDSDEDDD